MFPDDLRYALRRLAKSPGFVAMAVAALGLGIGANANIFSFVNAYLLRPLPTVKELDRLVYVSGQRRGNSTGVSYLDFLDFAQQSQSYEALVAAQVINPILAGRGEPERILGERVSGGFFAVYTVTPAAGRAFLPDELKPGGEPVVLITDGFWQRHFGGKAEAIGQSMVLDGVSHKIVGIMPPQFKSSWSVFDFYAPLALDTATSPRERRSLDVDGRLKKGVTLAGAQAEMTTIARRLELQYPQTNQEQRAVVEDFLELIGQGPRESLRIMIGVVTFVLLIACSNVTNLQLARATGRANEIAVRIALGASRWRIIRQVLVESLVVSLAGGVVGYWLSLGGAKLLLASIPPTYQPINQDFLDFRIVLYTAAVAIATGLISGLAPAFQVSGVGIAATLKEGGRTPGMGTRGRLRNALVVVEVALALVLLLASGLLVQSFARMQQANPGFRVDGILTANLFLPDAKYPRPDARANFFRDLEARARAIPGVQSAAVSTYIPMQGGGPGTAFVVEGRPAAATGQETIGRIRSISPAHLQTIGIPLRRGRYFTEQDDENSPRVVIINERLAQQYFPNGEPIGQRLKWSRDPSSAAPWMTIVGVAGDVKVNGMTSPAVPEMYAPFRQETRPYASIIMRTASADPTGVTAAFRAELRALDRDQPVTAIRTMQQIVEESMTVSRLMSVLMTIFAMIALAMAVMGIYGVVSYSVAQRTREVGIRMALGAGSGSVIQLVLRQSMWMLLLGVGIGVPLAAAVTKFLQFLLYGVGARDPLTFVGVPLVLLASGLVASYVPARRATRVDPVIALRCE